MFCPSLQNSVCFDEKSNVTPCCRFRSSLYDKHQFQTQNLYQAWTSPEFEMMRAQMESGLWPKGCQICKDQEDRGIKSKRLVDMNSSSGVLEPLGYIELFLGNLCNMKCVMCNESASHLIAKEKNPIATPKQTDVIEKLKSLPKNLLKTLKLLGGEPFIAPEFQKVLQFLEEHNELKKIDLEVSSNASYFPEAFVEKLMGARQVELTLSIDALGERAQYIRYGQKWDRILQTINRWMELKPVFPNLKLVIGTTISCLNIDIIEELVMFSESLPFDRLDVWLLSQPEDISVHALPIHSRKEVLQKIEHSFLNRSPSKLRPHRLEELKTALSDQSSPRGNFVEFLNEIDKKRNTNWRTIFPLLQN